MFKLLSNRLYAINARCLTINCRHYASIQSQAESSKERTIEIKIEKPITEQPHDDLGHFDLVINGGGIVGLTFLLNLQSNPFLSKKRILLIEQQNQPSSTGSSSHQQNGAKRVLSNRVSSLTEASRQCFEQNGVWSQIDEYTKRIREMQIWSSNLNKAISFDDDDGSKNVVYIVENNIILNALNRCLNHEQILYATNVTEILEIDNQITLFTKSNTDESMRSKLTCSLLIGCDGYKSLVRGKSNLNYFDLPLDQNGVVGTVSMCPNDEKNLDNSISFQRFLPNRTVVAVLPLTNEQSSFVISTSKEYAKQLVEIDDEQFVDQFNHLLDSEVDSGLPSLIRNFDQLLTNSLPCDLIKSTRNRTLPKISAVQHKSRAAFPLGFGTTLPSLVGGIRKSSNINLAIIGDSAHRVHPLAGQGLNLGIGDAMVLTNCLNASAERGEELFTAERGDIGPLEKERLESVLNEFERERQLKLIAMMSTIHTMQDLFYLTPQSLLNAFDHMNLIKKQMVRYANSV